MISQVFFVRFILKAQCQNWVYFQITYQFMQTFGHFIFLFCNTKIIVYKKQQRTFHVLFYNILLSFCYIFINESILLFNYKFIQVGMQQLDHPHQSLQKICNAKCLLFASHVDDSFLNLKGLQAFSLLIIMLNKYIYYNNKLCI